MSALVDVRPAGIDLLFRPGTTLTLTLTWPTGALAGRSFSSTLSGVPLAVDVIGDVMTVEATDTQTGAVAAAAEWLLLEDVGGTDEPIIVGTWAPSEAASAASQASVTVTQGSAAVEVTVQGIVTANDLRGANEWAPEDCGVIAWSYDPYYCNNQFTATNGQLYLMGLQLRKPTVISNVVWIVNTAAVTPVAGQNHVGLYSSAGTRLATVNVDAEIVTPGAKTTAITPVTQGPGFVWVAYLFNAATPPSFTRMGSSHAAGLNLGRTASTARTARAGTSLTTLPASINPASNVLQDQSFWAAVS